MTSVEGNPMRTGQPLAASTPAAASPRPGADGPASSTSSAGSKPPAISQIADPPQGGTHPSAGLASLLAQARIAQAQLVAQPLPITNHHSRLVTKLFGG